MKSGLAPWVVLTLLLLAAGGCQHYGPRTIVADRIPYNNAIALSWKEQTLLNIVKLRYVDTPFFVDVPQITSGYTLQGIATTNGGIFPPVSNLASFAQQLGLTMNFQAAYQDRPTISYQPQTGSQFIRNLTTPINPGSVMFLLQSGYPADVVFHLTVDTINGIKNQAMTAGQFRPADPDFLWIASTLRKAQLAGHVGIRVDREKDKGDSVAFLFQDAEVDPALAKELAQVRKLLRLDHGEREFRVTFGGMAANHKEISILTRSVYRILQELANGVEVPEDHLARGVAPVLEGAGVDPLSGFRVLSGCKKPCDPFIAACYEGRWFWIEKNDQLSKRTLSHLLVLLALADTGAKENLPVITIQAN